MCLFLIKHYECIIYQLSFNNKYFRSIQKCLQVSSGIKDANKESLYESKKTISLDKLTSNEQSFILKPLRINKTLQNKNKLYKRQQIHDLNFKKLMRIDTVQQCLINGSNVYSSTDSSGYNSSNTLEGFKLQTESVSNLKNKCQRDNKILKNKRLEKSQKLLQEPIEVCSKLQVEGPILAPRTIYKFSKPAINEKTEMYQFNNQDIDSVLNTKKYNTIVSNPKKIKLKRHTLKRHSSNHKEIYSISDQDTQKISNLYYIFSSKF